MARQHKSEEELPDELPRRKWWLPPLIGLIVLAGFIVAGRKVYGRVEPERLSRRAKVMIEQGDYRGAMITLSRALQINNNSKTATKMMLELMETLQFPTTIEWHRRLSDLNPGSSKEAMKWAEFALKEGQSEVAEKALDAVPAAGRSTADFQSAAGVAAIRNGKWKLARDFFAEAQRLDPDNDLHRYNHALALLQSPDDAERTAAVGTLVELSTKGSTQIHAYRALIPKLARDGKAPEALTQSAALVALPEAKFKDFIVHAELLRHLEKPEWKQAIDQARSLAATVEVDAAAMVNWLRLNGLEEDALQWSVSLDPAMTDAPLVRAARAECFVNLKRWDDLRRVSSTDPWGSQEFRRLAFLSLAQFQQGERTASAGSWTSALRVCRGDRGRLGQLAMSAAQWGWTAQMREALWVATESAAPGWALQTLYRSYQAEKDLRGMLRVARRMMAVNSGDAGARNNVALFSVLLRENLKEALAISGQLLVEQPENPIFLSTHSMALLANGMPEESLAELERLKPAQLADPAYAPYLAFAYQANGDLARAREFAGKIDPKSLLPEELALVETLKQRL